MSSSSPDPERTTMGAGRSSQRRSDLEGKTLIAEPDVKDRLLQLHIRDLVSVTVLKES